MSNTQVDFTDVERPAEPALIRGKALELIKRVADTWAETMLEALKPEEHLPHGVSKRDFTAWQREIKRFRISARKENDFESVVGRLANFLMDQGMDVDEVTDAILIDLAREINRDEDQRNQARE